MKIFYVALVVLCGMVATGSADASTWVKIVESGTSQIFVDTDSINRTGNIVAAWYRREFRHPITTENNRLSYKSAKVFNYYNCSSNEVASAQWITYADQGGQGKVVSNERVSSLEYGDIPPGETGKPVFDFVCKHAFHKI